MLNFDCPWIYLRCVLCGLPDLHQLYNGGLYPGTPFIATCVCQSPQLCWGIYICFINVYTAAIRFFFEYTPGYVWDSRKIPKMKRDRQLPVVITREQVGQLIDSMDNYKHKAITATMYSSGLRVSEVCRLRYGDIRRKQKMIYVSTFKNRQDRYTILSEKNLEILTEYWYRYNRPMGWLFPSTVRDEPLTAAVELFVKKQVQKLGLPEGVTPHTMRHCFACHMLEDGVSHTFIQQLLGHRSPGSTDVYLLALPTIPELFALCIILAFALKDTKIVSGNNA